MNGMRMAKLVETARSGLRVVAHRPWNRSVSLVGSSCVVGMGWNGGYKAYSGVLAGVRVVCEAKWSGTVGWLRGKGEIKRIKKTTARGIPEWSPTSVLTTLAWA